MDFTKGGMVWMFISCCTFQQSLTVGLGPCILENSTDADLPAEKRLPKCLVHRYQEMGTLGRPVLNPNDNVTVYYGMALVHLVHMDVETQTLKVKMWISYRWKDIFLRWHPDSYSGIDRTQLRIENIWKPDVVLWNSDAKMEHVDESLITVNHNGAVEWMPQVVMEASCNATVLYFPKDEVNCSLQIGSWVHTAQQIDVRFYKGKKYMSLKTYLGSHEWEIIENSAVRSAYENLGDSLFLYFILRLQRKSAFYIYILVVPSILLSCLNPVIFLMPPSMGERTGLGIGIFSAFFLLLVIVADTIPPASTNVPLIGIYHLSNMALCILGIFLSSPVVKAQEMDDTKPLPLYLTWMMVSKYKGNNIRTDSMGSEEKLKQQENASDNLNTSNHTVQAGKERQSMEDWKLLSKNLDKIFFVIFVIIEILLLLFILGYQYA